MSFVILPDEILDTQLCDNCHKYLSVKPITIYLGKVICGRCQKSVESVPSIYNNLMDNVLYKCVNRFDGCHKVLCFDQVVEHEKNCKDSEYICPGCPKNSPKIPTYMFPYHIKKTHKKSYLTSNSFQVELVDEITNIFFYQKNNYLFFILVQYSEKENNLLLNACYVGDTRISKVFQKYEISCGGWNTKCEKSECKHVSYFRGTGIRTARLNNEINEDNLITVNFEFEMPIILPYISIQSSTATDLISPVKIPFRRADFFNIIRALYKASTQAVETCKSPSCSFGRSLHICYCYNTFPDHINLSKCGKRIEYKTYSISQAGAGKVSINVASIETISLCFHCILCKSVRDFEDMFIITLLDNKCLICIFCRELIVLMDECTAIPLSLTMSRSQYEAIECKKSASNGNFFVEFTSFDDNVSYIPEQKMCCVSNCYYTAYDFDELKEHFRNDHELTLHVSSNLIPVRQMSLLKGNYIFHWNIIICVTLEKLKNVHWLTADIFDKDCPSGYQLLCGLYSEEKKLLGILYKSKMEINVDEIAYITFITFRHDCEDLVQS